MKFKNVVIGRVTGVRLSQDRSRVVAKVALEKSAEGFATACLLYTSDAADDNVRV
ncbi:hypothetical protein [Dyella sp. ASV21]|uniref:hypothetical protein n=1 Tax=Dyella sp. ASV21 TaxID=2795114 RepID=UPI0031B7F13C